MAYTQAYLDRVNVIRQLGWTDQKAIAASFGFPTLASITTKVFPGTEDDKSWSDFSEYLAKREFERDGLEVEITASPAPSLTAPPAPSLTAPPAPPAKASSSKKAQPAANGKNRYATDYLTSIGVAIGSDGDQLKTDLKGNPINF